MAREACENPDQKKASRAAEVVQATLSSGREITQDNRLYCTYKLEDRTKAALAKQTHLLHKDVNKEALLQIQKKFMLKHRS